MVRTGEGAGVTGIIMNKTTVDLFNPKTIRASMGALFRINCRYFNSFEEYEAEYGQRDLYPFMLDGSCPLEEAAAAIQKPFALVFGNEGRGLPAEFAQMGRAVRIPHSNQIDSLNLSIAAAIGVYTFMNRGK